MSRTEIFDRRSPAVVVVVAFLGAALVAACGGSAADKNAEGSSPSTSGPNRPIVVTHRYGSTTIPAPPRRIISLDTQWTDVLIAMGEPPAAYALDPSVKSGTYPWRGKRLEHSQGIPVTDSIPFERVAALKPDLIVVTWAVTERSDYDLLSRIAPTIPSLTSNQVDSWQDIVTTAGKVLRAASRANAIVRDAQQESARVRRSLSGLAGKTFAMANYVPGDAIYVVADPKDGSTVFFDQLGLAITPTILDQADNASGRVELSTENISLLDADVLVFFTNGADPSKIPGYATLPAVRNGAVAVLDYTAVVGLNTPTPLSIPYSLERITPALKAAARA